MTRWAQALEERQFAERLDAFLALAREESGASAVVVVWADARCRVLARRVQRASPAHAAVVGTVVDPTLAAALASHVDSAAYGVHVHPLEISPPFFASEAFVIVLGSVPLPAEAVHALEEAASEERRKDLGAAALAAFNHARDAMELTDGEVRLVHVNRAWERLFGYARSEVVGGFPTMLRLEEENLHDADFYRFAEESATRDHWSGVMVSRARDGARVLQETTMAPFPDLGSGIAGNVGVRRALGGREARERDLDRMQLEFRAVLTDIPIPLAVRRDDFLYFANPSFYALLGRGSAEVIGRSLGEFVVPDDVALVRDVTSTEVQTVRVRRPDGSIRVAELTRAGAVSFEGYPSNILLARDSTDERVTSEREAHASRLAALGALSASVAHEINTPLAYVLANLEAVALGGGSGPEPIAEAIEGARRIERIISDLRSFSRLGDASGEREPIDVERAVSVAVNLAANRLRHTAEVARSHEPGLRVHARETQLVQVLLNLLVNAAHAVEGAPPEQRRIEIRSASQLFSRVTIEVRDYGPGIPAEALRRIFEPFFTTRGSDGGTGLGLSVSRRIVEGFGGTITASSTSGMGASFVIELDRAPAHVETSATMPPPSIPKRVHRARILVVDDEPAVGRALARLMREHDVVIAESGAEALPLLRAGPTPDLILCDLMMPGMTGPELFEAIRREAPLLSNRFVFLTGGTFTHAATDFVDNHRDRLLMKPFTRSQVRDALTRVSG
jgi:two-component system cell cycle sensor histidine kinase/response regulator CckA